MSVALHESFNLCEKRMHCISEETVMYRSGNNLIFYSTLTKKQTTLTFEVGQSLDCYTTTGEAKPRIVCATHGTKTQIHVYDFPRKQLVKNIVLPDKNRVGLLAVTRDGRYLITISQIGPSHLGYWDLSTGKLLVEVPVADDYTFVEFNPHNPQQVVCGHSKRLTIWCIGASTKFQKPTLTPLEVEMDVSSKIDRQILAHRWIGSSKIVVSSPTGELLLCDFTEAQAHLKSTQNGPKLTNLVPSALGGVGGQAAIAASTSIQGLSTSGALKDPKLLLTVIASRLPFAYDEEQDGDNDEEDEAEAQSRGLRRGRWGMNKGAVVYSMVSTARHLVVGTEDGSVLWLNSTNYRVAYMQRFDKAVDAQAAISYLDFVPSFNACLAMNLRGQLIYMKIVGDLARIEHDYKQDEPLFQNLTLGVFPLAVQFRSGRVLRHGVKIVPPQPGDYAGGGPKLVSYNAHNVMLWSFVSKELLASFSFKTPITSLTTSPDGAIIVVGLQSGVVCVLDASKVIIMRLVHALKFHQGPVLQLSFNKEGDVFSSLGADRILFLRGADFKVLGFTPHTYLYSADELQANARIEKEHAAQQKLGLDATPSAAPIHPPIDAVLTMSWTGCPPDDDGNGAERLVVATRLGHLVVFKAPTTYHDVSGSLQLTEDYLSVVKTDIGVAAKAITSSILSQERNHIFALTEDKLLRSFVVEATGSCTSAGEYGSECGAVHESAGTHITMSRSGLLVSAGSDGQIILRNHRDKKSVLQMAVHDFSAGGVTEVCVSEDGQYLLSAGADGGVFAWNIAAVEGQMGDGGTPSSKIPITIRSKVLDELPSIDEPSPDCPIFTVQANQAGAGSVSSKVADNRQRVQKEQLERNLDAFKSVFQGVLQKNDEAHEMEKLELSEFAIDLEMRDKLINDGLAHVDRMREEITLEFNGKELVTSKVKTQCWDSMAEHGMMFRAFKSGRELHNFPLRSPTLPEIKRTEKIEHLRKMQLLELQWIAAQREHSEEAPASTTRFDPTKLTDGCPYVVNVEVEAAVAEAEESKEAKESEKDSSKKKEEKKDEDKEAAEALAKRKKAEGEEFPEFLLFHPFACTTAIRKRMQAQLMAKKIESLKLDFNKKFVATFASKEREIDMIHEKAKRIQEIQEELRIAADVYRPALAQDEVTDAVLVVKDDEISSERVLTQKERLVLERKQEEARLKALVADDGPERALEDFMGGTLEAKRDLSLLDAELVREEWMDLPAEQMTDEQQVQYAAFLKRTEEIKEEKETRRKLLQTELNKLNSEVADICKSFDASADALAEARVEVMRKIYQDELMIIMLANDLVREEQQAENLKEMSQRLLVVQGMQVSTSEAVAGFHETAEAFARELEMLQAGEKSSDRNFKKDFADAGEHLDVLYKLFRSKKGISKARDRQASITSSAPRMFGEWGGEGGAGGNKGEKMKDVHGLNPLPAVGRDTMVDKVEVADLDPSEMPEEMDPELWMQFLERRRTHVAKEHEVKKALHQFQQMQKHLVVLQQAEAVVAAEAIELAARLTGLEARRIYRRLDTQIMLRVRQGQVEIEESPVVTDLKDVEMIQTVNVALLNLDIKKLGKEKVAILKEISVSRTAIHLQKWNKKKLALEHADAVDLTTELQLLRVTKSLQNLIKMGGHDNQKAAELKRLDRKMEFLNQATREKSLGKKMKILAVKKQIRQQNRENERLLETVQELEAAVRERVQISTIRDGESHDDGKTSGTRMKALVTRRKLVDLAKLQAEEIKFLRDQVESLRKRTFASFAVPHLPANPDEKRYQEEMRAMTNHGSRAQSRSGSRAQTR